MDCVQIILFLKFYLRRIFGDHYPTEIITYIIMISYRSICVKCGWDHTSAMVNGKIYTWGNNSGGELGIGLTKYKNFPQQLFLEHIKKIKIGICHTSATTYSNDIYIWGKTDYYDQSDILQKISCDTPHKLPVSKIKHKHNIYHPITIMLQLNKIYIAYDTIAHYVGNCKTDDIRKIKYYQPYIIILTKNGNLHRAKSNIHEEFITDPNPDISIDLFQTLLLVNIMTIDCGSHHAIFLSSNNEIYVCGQNINGQLGLGDKIDKDLPQKLDMAKYVPNYSDLNVLSVRCGGYHTMILLSQDIIYIWGSNFHGELGLGHYDSVLSPQKLSLRGITQIRGGGHYTIAVTRSDTVYAWGKNANGQLGLANNKDRPVPTRIQFEF